MNSATRFSRRNYLKTTAGALAALTFGGATGLASQNLKGDRKRVLRLAHITDIHVQPELGAGDGLTQCLQHIAALPDPVDLVINTGDSVMDCLAHDEARVNLIWDLWQSILAKELHHPIRSVLGNHDIWGLDKKASKTTGNEPGWGKQMALQRLGLKRPYYSFDQAGWHFIGLDTAQPVDDHYRAYIDDEQFDWLSKDLQAVDSKTPVLIFSHIPIVGVAPLLNNDAAATGEFVVPGSKIVLDNVRIKNLFKRFPNIRLCLSGHIHLIDQIEYLGVTYLCGGAVCGDYWKGIRNGECDAGYSIVDLYDDGSTERDYHTYGWVYRT
jgi:Icc protein